MRNVSDRNEQHQGRDSFPEDRKQLRAVKENGVLFHKPVFRDKSPAGNRKIYAGKGVKSEWVNIQALHLYF